MFAAGLNNPMYNAMSNPMMMGFSPMMNLGGSFPAMFGSNHLINTGPMNYAGPMVDAETGQTFFDAAAAQGPQPERFASSQMGGVILGADGTPMGRIAPGSFVDLKDGRVYDPQGKAVSLEKGATVDFFDLDDIQNMTSSYKATTAHTAGGGGKGSTPTYGQWGPGGLTNFNGGMDHSSCAAGSSTSTGGSTKGGGANATGGTAGTYSNLYSQLQQSMQNLSAMFGALGGGGSMPAMGNGFDSMGAKGAMGGYGMMGMMPARLEHSLHQLVFTLRDLVNSLQKNTASTSTASNTSNAGSSTSTNTSTNASTSTNTNTSTNASTNASTSTGATTNATTSTSTDSSRTETSTSANTTSTSSS